MVFAIVLASMSIWPQAALASACQANESPHDFVSTAWFSGAGANLDGFRAPTRLRSAALCNGSPVLSASFEFVAIQGNSIWGNQDAGIIQIGWVREQGLSGYCKFFWYSRGDQYYNNPAVAIWDCNSNLATNEYFKVDKNGSKYDLYDCDTGGWTSCSVAVPDFAISDWTASSIFAFCCV